MNRELSEIARWTEQWHRRQMSRIVAIGVGALSLWLYLLEVLR